MKTLHAASGMDAPSAFLKIGDSGYATANRSPSSFFVLRYVDIDGGWPGAAVDAIGISINDHEGCTYTDNQAAGVPTLYRERILIEHCRVRNTEGEGMYVGPNWRDTTPSFPNPEANELPLGGIEIRYNEIDNTSWDLCNCKSWIAGDNKIHHKVMRNGSQALNAGQSGGITANNCHVQILNSSVENTGNPGIQTYMYQMPDSLPFGPFEAVVYNNVVCNLFTVPGDQAAKGVNAGVAGHPWRRDPEDPARATATGPARSLTWPRRSPRSPAIAARPSPNRDHDATSEQRCSPRSTRR